MTNEVEDTFYMLVAIHFFCELAIHILCKCSLYSKDINPLYESTFQRMSFYNLHTVYVMVFVLSAL